MLDVKIAAHLQRELLRAAVDCCKVGGTIVYSTCSITAEENEAVIDYILKKRFVKIVETGLPIDKEGITSYEENRYDPRVKLSRRVYPHMHNMDGFFIAKLIKNKDGKRLQEGEETTKKTPKSHETQNIVSKKGMGKRDRMKLKGKKKHSKVSAHKKETDENERENEKETDDHANESNHHDVGEEDEMLKKRKMALKAKIALIKKKKLT